MLRSVNLRDYMQEKPVTVPDTAPLLEAMQKILSHRISGLCVVDEQHNLVGMLSELDCLRGVLDATYQSGRGGLGQVREYMTAELDTAALNENIVSVATDMVNKRQRRRPVVDENGKLIGQITCRQLLNAVRDFSLVQSQVK